MTKNSKTVVWLFYLVAALTLAAGLIPLLRGRPVNVVFVVIGAVWLIIAIAVSAKRKTDAT